MFGFLIGTACLIGLIATLRRGHGGGCGGYAYGGGCGRGGMHAWSGGGGHHHGHHGGGWGGYRGDEHHERGRGRGGFAGFRGWGPRAWVSRLSEGLSQRLDLTPAQEKVLVQSITEVRESFRKGRGELRETRRDVAKAFRADTFDAESMGETFSRHNNSIDEVRKAVTGALARLHEALDEGQRAKLAEMLEEGWW